MVYQHGIDQMWKRDVELFAAPAGQRAIARMVSRRPPKAQRSKFREKARRARFTVKGLRESFKKDQ